MSVSSVSISSDVNVRYQRLAQEYTKLRAQAKVLREGVLEERGKCDKLTEELKSKEAVIRRMEAENESLTFRNDQLARRIENFQLESPQKPQKAQECSNSRISILEAELSLKIAENEELVRKMTENEQKFERELAEMSQKLAGEIRKLEDDKFSKMEEKVEEVEKIPEISSPEPPESIEEAKNMVAEAVRDTFGAFQNLFQLLQQRTEIYPFDITMERLPPHVEKLSSEFAQTARLFGNLLEIDNYEEKSEVISICRLISRHCDQLLRDSVEKMADEESRVTWCNSALQKLNSEWKDAILELFDVFQRILTEKSILEALDRLESVTSGISEIFEKRWILESRLPTTTRRMRCVGAALQKAILVTSQEAGKLAARARRVFEHSGAQIGTAKSSGTSGGQTAENSGKDSEAVRTSEAKTEAVTSSGALPSSNPFDDDVTDSETSSEARLPSRSAGKDSEDVRTSGASVTSSGAVPSLNPFDDDVRTSGDNSGAQPTSGTCEKDSEGVRASGTSVTSSGALPTSEKDSEAPRGVRSAENDSEGLPTSSELSYLSAQNQHLQKERDRLFVEFTLCKRKLEKAAGFSEKIDMRDLDEIWEIGMQKREEWCQRVADAERAVRFYEQEFSLLLHHELHVESHVAELTSRLDDVTRENQKLEDELESVRRSYEAQLGDLSDHLANLVKDQGERAKEPKKTSEFESQSKRIGKEQFLEIRDEKGRNVLFHAALTDNLKNFQYIVKKCGLKNDQLLTLLDNSQATVLHWATHFGAGKVIKFILEMESREKISISKLILSKDAESVTPLHISATKSDVKFLKMFIDKLAEEQMDKNVWNQVQDRKMRSPLHYAASKVNLEAIRMILDRPQLGFNVDQRDKTGIIPLMCAVGVNLPQAGPVIRLLEKKKPVSKTRQNKDGMTALHIAVAARNLEAVKILMDLGCAIDLVDNEQRTPLHYAAEHGYPEIVEYLIKQGARNSTRDLIGATPAHYAAQFNSDCLAIIFEESRISEVKDNENRTCLMWAVVSGNIDVIHYLIQRNPAPDRRESDKHGYTALHLVAMVGNEQVCKILINQGWSLSERDNHGNTALHLASGRGHTDVLRCLVAAGAHMSEVDEVGRTAVFWACMGGQSHTLHIMIKELSFEWRTPGTINTRPITDNFGRTALHAAANAGFSACINVLLNIEQEDNFVSAPLVGCRDKNGETALHEACLAGKLDCVLSLLKGGSAINAFGKLGRTPLDCSLSANGSSKLIIDHLRSEGGLTYAQLQDTASIVIQRCWRAYRQRTGRI